MHRDELEALIRDATGAKAVTDWQPIQSLWSGYGQIWRVSVAGHSVNSLIVKHVQPPAVTRQPRGWNTDQSHQRKLRSYAVESAWYRDFSMKTDDHCRIAKCHQVISRESEFVFVLEDLDQSGFGQRHARLPIEHVRHVLSWLARFHARFIDTPPNGLWPVGTYWHLATRPDELAAMPHDDPLRVQSAEIDRRLNQCLHPTIVHGDAKIANFCFGDQPDQIAAVDFQYVGGGCGMKDVAYFLGSCLSETQCEQYDEMLLDDYFTELCIALPEHIDPVPLQTHWRSLYPLAWADFNRFLLGWYPEHSKLHRYSQRMTDEAIALITSADA